MSIDTRPQARDVDPVRTTPAAVDLRRLASPATTIALVLLAVSSIGEAVGAVVIGRIASDPTLALVITLALTTIGSAVLDTIGRTVWAAVADRAEGALREDLVTAALAQPVATLSDTAVGEILDRVDDDTHEVGTLVRGQLWQALRVVVIAGPLWVVGGVTWWPAWILLPTMAVLALGVIRTRAATLTAHKVVEEAAWTDHSAALEEAVAARDDLRTSGGQGFALRRSAELAAAVHRAFARVIGTQNEMTLRSGLILNAVLAVLAVGGALATAGRHLSIGELVTLFAVTVSFVGSVNGLVRHLPELQAGMGAVTRLRQLLGSTPEPDGGAALPDGPLGLDLHSLTYTYQHGTFSLREIDLHVAPGTTCALVGRTGSGKSTLASLISRAVDPPPGTVSIGGRDITTIDLEALRRAVGVVTQRTEILVGTLAQNIALFGDTPRERIVAAVDQLRLTEWVAGLPSGLDTPLGPGGVTLSAGEQQLVAFARLLVRDVRVVILDEATARMDPVTEARVVAAAEHLLTGRTGLLIAHRLGTVARADTVAVLDRGRLVDHGTHAALSARPGPFRAMLDAAGDEHAAGDTADVPENPADATAGDTAVGTARRTGEPPPATPVGSGPSLARGIVSLLCIHPRWGLRGALLFLFTALTGAFGAVTAWTWGRVVTDVGVGTVPLPLLVALTASLLASPVLLATALRGYTRWWIAGLLRVRTSVLAGQTNQHRLPPTPPGEVVARALDADRYVTYADRWVDVINGVLVVIITVALAGSLLAGGVLAAVMLGVALASAVGRPIAGRSAAESSAARARFGRSLVSALEAVRTVKLAAATDDVRAHLREIDGGRVTAAVREHRVQAVLAGAPMVLVYGGMVATWAIYLAGGWPLATALLVSGAVFGFEWFGQVAGAVVTEAPGTRAWQKATAEFAGGRDLMHIPPGVDLVRGTTPTPAPTTRTPLRRLALTGVDAVHDDGTLGVVGVDLTVDAGELVLLLGPIGSGKSTLLAALAGLVAHRGVITWNGEAIEDPQTFLRPERVAYVAQVPRVMSGTFAENIALDHPRPVDQPIDDARLAVDVADAGGPDALVGHRGVRLSGGQVQRLALARALATRPELLVADDVSSALDATTETELWRSLRARGTAVIGSTSKRAALEQADRVVVLTDGRVEDIGPWSDLQERWNHLAG